MATRTNPTDVKAIMDNCNLSDPVVQAVIDAVNLLITEHLAGATCMTDALLEEIEKWYTAHVLASTLCRSAKKEKVGDAEVEYTGQYGMDLDSTPYGQFAKQLDCSGNLGSVGKKAASIYAVTSFE